MKKTASLLLGLSAVVTLSGAALGAQSLFSLRTLEKGEWTLTDKDHDFRPVKRICLRNPEALVRLKHLGQQCQVNRLSGDARSAVFSYRCNGSHGNTTIRRENDRLVQISSQGLDRGAPFAFEYEARKTGGC